MIDTIKLKIKSVPYAYLEKIRVKLIEKSAVDNQTGEVLYNIVSGSLKGSYDNNISVNVFYDQYEYTENDKKYITEIKSGYLYVEFSLHKFLLGQNVIGGTKDLNQLEKFQNFLESYFAIELPSYKEWELYRLDWAINFNLPKEQIFIYMRSMKNLSFSRRKVHVYGNETIYCPGATTTIKIYYKGAEFTKHDYPKLKKFLAEGKLHILAQIVDVSKDVLRCEVEMKPRLLRKEFGMKVIKRGTKELTTQLQPKVKDIDINRINEIYDKELEKLMKNRQVQISKNNEVISFLKTHEEKNWSIYYNTWVLFQTQTPQEVKNLIGKDKYYRHTKILKDYNIVIGGLGDIQINKDFNLIPVDFNLYSDSKYILKNNSEIAI